MGIAALVAMPHDPACIFVAESLRHLIGHARHDSFLLVAPIGSRSLETQLEQSLLSGLAFPGVFITISVLGHCGWFFERVFVPLRGGPQFGGAWGSRFVSG